MNQFQRLQPRSRTQLLRLVTFFCFAALLCGSYVFAQAGSNASQANSSFTVNLWERIASGGPVMIPIGLCSVLVLAFTMERLIATRRGRVAPGGFVEDVSEVLEEESVAEAQQLCTEESHSLARVVGAGLEHAHGTKDEVRMVMEGTAQREVAILRKNLRALSVTAAVAPLLGLLGTVGGMIDVFDKYSEAADATDKVRVFSSGISQALVTTFAGLTVSIPATVIYHFFLARISRFADEVHRAYGTLFEGRVPIKRQAPVRSVPAAEVSP